MTNEDTFKLPKRGRPRKPGPGSRTIGTRVPMDTWKTIHVIAESEDRTVAYIAARMLNTAVRSLKQS